MSEDKRDIGWEYLHSKDEEGSFSEDDGSWGYTNSDGSGSYHGADGSWGYKNADGSASFHGADGSWGYRNADGSSSYHGSDGTWGYKNSDGTSSCSVRQLHSTLSPCFALLLFKNFLVSSLMPCI